MPKIAISDLTLRALAVPPRGQVDFWDTKLPNFGIRVSQGGSKTFILKVYNARRTIGRYPLISLSEARTEAKRILAEKTLGKVRPQSITFPHARALFLEDKARSAKARTLAEYKRLLNRLSFKSQLATITHEDVSRELGKIKSPSEHAHLVVVTNGFFNWCIKRRYLTENPARGISRQQSTPRARVLSDAELKSIWRVTTEPTHFNAIVRLLILAGQRRGEIAALRAEYISGDLCTLPSELTKNGRQHLFPLGSMGLHIVGQLLSSSTAQYLFPARGSQTPFNGWSKCKNALDKKAAIAPWTLHDLRRTFATKLAQLGVAPHIIERILNHVTGTLSPIALIYNRATYLEEMRAAMALYERHLSGLFAAD